MDVLFVISVVCFFGLFVAALAIARHVRVERRPATLEARHRLPSSSPLELHPEHRAPFRPCEQSLGSLAHCKQPDWRFLVSGDRHRTSSFDSPHTMLRKPLTPVRPASPPRPDWAYFNQDLGDLSDPYQTSTRKADWTDNIEPETSFRHERTS